MYWRIISFLLVFAISSNLYGQDLPAEIKERKNPQNVTLPVNLYDSFSFGEEYLPYIRNGLYLFGPLFMMTYGFTTWGWDTRESFTFHPETYKGAYAVNGAADKYGHLYGNYVMKRFATFLFRASGSSRRRANIEGAILTEIVTLGGEIGDGFAPDYGFDPYDILFNNIGILFGMLLDYSPFLDRIFTISWEYIPTREMREKFNRDHHDIFTDYGGAKVILVTKFAGIPYISFTPLRYINFNLGYYARGYNPTKYFSSRTRNVYIGFSINLSIVFGDVLPVGYVSSSIQSIFNYYHLPWDYEAKIWTLSDKPHEDFE